MFAEQEQLGIHIDVCSGCGGIWFDSGELARYVKQAARTRTESGNRLVVDKDQPVSRCPNCSMVEFVYADLGDLPLQKCRNCRGIFVTKSAFDTLRPSTAAEKAGGALVDGVVEAGLEGLGEVIEWIIDGALDSL